MRDWDAWLEDARRQRLSGAIWTAFRDNGVQAALPASVAERLESDWRQSVAASALIHHGVSSIAATLDTEKIPWILLKGPSVADALYSDPGARPMADIDILVRPSDFLKSLDLLQHSGWHLRDDMHPRYLEITHAVMICQDPCVSVLEVHWNLLGTVPLAGESGLWEAPEEIEIGGRIVKCLMASDKALHLAIHAVLHHGLHSSAQMLDICLACARLERDGWEEFTDRAKALGVVEEAFVALSAAKSRLNLSVPEDVMDKLQRNRPGKLRRKAVQLAISDMGGHAATTLSRLIVMDGWQHKKNYLTFVLFPPKEWLARLDGDAGPGAYFRRAFSGLGKALRQIFLR